jgi:hypothetical protein
MDFPSTRKRSKKGNCQARRIIGEEWIWQATNSFDPQRLSWVDWPRGGRSFRRSGLGLSGNRIRDISAFLQNDGLGTGTVIHLARNPLGEEAYERVIPALRASGVKVMPASRP